MHTNIIYHIYTICFSKGEYFWSTFPTKRGGFDYFKGYLNSHVDYFNFTFEINSEGYGKVVDWRENEEILLNSTDYYTTEAFGEKAIEILEDISYNNDDTPFTMMLAWEAPHTPLHWAPDPWREEAINGGDYGNGQDTGNGPIYARRKQYNSMIRAMDDYIGQIVDTLKNKTVNDIPLWDNTWVFFMSDNGGTIQAASNRL